MPVDMERERLWQEESNSRWFTNIKPTCDLCGKMSNSILEYRINTNDEGTRACISDGKYCFKTALEMLLSENFDVDNILTRMIQYKAAVKTSNSCKRSKREPIGLSKRYTIMKRDGFQCILCGSSGKNSQLEIDHIVPVSAGGNESMSNLQTLCFKCNRGKSDKV